MTTHKRGICIKTNDWRAKIAQGFLRILYRRPSHYIAPWKHSALAANVLLFHKGKILLGMRSGDVEDTGVYWCAGGHIDVETGETFEQGAAREIFEETGITINISKLNVETLIYYQLIHNVQYFEIADASQLVINYIYILSDTEAEELQDSDEMKDWAYYTLEEVKNMDLVYGGLNVIKSAFKKLKELEAATSF